MVIFLLIFQTIQALILILILLHFYGLPLGYTTITSKFGYRNSPTSGASTYHSGIDIAAPSGANIIAVCSGIITYTGFNGSGGYTVTLKSNNISISYCHLSPTFLVYVGKSVTKGDIIATVGPKNVYGVPNNPYKDANGNPTNRSNYWSSFTFCNKKRRQSRQSFELLLNYYISSSSSQ